MASAQPSHPHHLREHIPSSSAANTQIYSSGPDDIKYLQKYNDLKQKVKDIELDNDKLHLKVLKTKKNIQRLRIERAILYERLSAMPTSELPPPQPPLLLDHSQHPPSLYPHIDPHHSIARRPPQELHSQPVVVHPHIQSAKDRRRLESHHRPSDYPDLPYPLLRPPSPPRLHHHPDPYRPAGHHQQSHNPIELDRPPPPQSARSRRPHGPRETDRTSSLPVSLPPPPNTLPFVPPHSNIHQGSNAPHSPHLERDDRAHGHPSDVGYHYAGTSTHRAASQRDSDRDHERAHLGGPGLPPMRTHHLDSHLQSPRPASSSSHNGYAHPLQHPFSSPDDRGWERDREFASYSVRDDRPRERRELHEPAPSNGYRDGTSHRYDGPPSHGNGSSLPSPDTYAPSRRSSQGHIRPDASVGGRVQEGDRRDYQPYDYARRQDSEAGATTQSRRRSFAEMSDLPHDQHRSSQKQRRDSQDSFDERRQIRRDREHDRDRDRTTDGLKDDVSTTVARVREGEAME